MTKTQMKQFMLLVLPAALLCLPLSSAKATPSKAGMEGWENGAPYHKLYNPKKLESFKGKLKEIITVVPMPGMAAGTALVVSTRKGREIIVHLGPKAFVDVSVIGLKPGDPLKIVGAFARAGQQRFFIASKIKKGEFVQVKLRRTKDGVPFWAMTMDEFVAFTSEFGPPNPQEPFNGLRYFTTGPAKSPPPKPGKELLQDKAY